MSGPLEIPERGTILKRTADLRCKFVVLGATFAGLFCAYNLFEAGHDVWVVEPRSDSLPKKPRISCLPPNVAHLLRLCGLEKEVQRISWSAPSVHYVSGRTLKTIANIAIEEDPEDVYMKFHYIHQDELLEVLYNFVLVAGIEVVFSDSIRKLDTLGQTLVLTDGREINSDLTIDSLPRSPLYKFLVSPEEGEWIPPKPLKRYALCLYSAPASAVQDNPFAVATANSSEYRIVTGTEWCVHIASKGEGCDVYFALMLEENEYAPEIARGTQLKLKDLNLPECHPQLRELISVGKEIWMERPIFQPRLNTWYNEKIPLLAVGSAAYLTDSGSLIDTNLAVGDGAVLGSLFSHLEDKSQIPFLLSAFQELRQPRARKANEWESEIFEFYCAPLCPDGEEEMSKHVQWFQDDEGVERSTFCEDIWGMYADVYGYHPYDAADEWWMKWGTGEEEEEDLIESIEVMQIHSSAGDNWDSE